MSASKAHGPHNSADWFKLLVSEPADVMQLIEQLAAGMQERQGDWTSDLLDAFNMLEGVLEDAAEAQSSSENQNAVEIKCYDSTWSRDKLLDLLRLLLDRRFLTVQQIANKLEKQTLVDLQILGNLKAFNIREARINTAATYKQRKFNLLREESEGFAQLLEVLINSMELQAMPSTSQESFATMAWRQISQVMAYYDLEPMRVLDLMLDVFGIYVRTQWKLILDIVEASPWVNRPYENRAPAAFLNALQRAMFEDVEESQQRCRGHSIVAHVIGLKFQHYTASGARGLDVHAPEGLYLLSALFIQRDIITIAQLLPYVGPDSTGMSRIQAAHEAKFENKSKAPKLNALAMAAALSDDARPGLESRTVSAGALDSQEAPVTKQIIDEQLVALAEALLIVGALAPALVILGQHPFLFGYRISIAKAYLCCAEVMFNVQDPSLQDSPPDTFTPIWDLPKATCDQDRWLIVDRVFKVSGLYLCHAPQLFGQICIFLKENQEDTPRLDVISTLILPALSLSQNEMMIKPMVELFKSLDLSQRYNLYGEWRDRIYKSCAELKAQQLQTETDIKNLLKRFNSVTDDLKAFARNLVNKSQANPLISFGIMLNQISSYDNLVAPLAQACRSLDWLGSDVLVFAIVDRLSDPAKSRIKIDGLNASHWLQSLATFIALLINDGFDPSCLFHFLVHRLVQSKLTEMIVLREIFAIGAGVEPPSDWSLTMAEGLSGGQELKKLLASAVAQSTTNKALQADHIVQFLVNDHQLAVPLIVLIAQLSFSHIFHVTHDENATKVLGNEIDEAKSLLLQLLQLLRKQQTQEQYSAMIPSCSSLVSEYSLPPAIAFTISRTPMEVGSKAWQQSIHSMAITSNVGAEFYHLFWQMTSAEVSCPSKKYEEEILKLAQRSGEQEQDREILRVLEQEMQSHQALTQKIREHFITHYQALWNNEGHEDQEQYSLIVEAIVYDCLLPRSTLSVFDSLYCAKIVEILLSSPDRIGLTLQIIQEVILNGLRLVILQGSKDEAKYFAHFIGSIMEIVASLQSSQIFFEQIHTAASDTTWQALRNLTAFWQTQLLQIFVDIIEGSEYMCLRNVMLIYNESLVAFPAIKSHGLIMQDKVTSLIEKESRDDLKILATSFLARVRKRTSMCDSDHSYANLFPESASSEVVDERTTTEPTDEAEHSALLHPGHPDATDTTQETANDTKDLRPTLNPEAQPFATGFDSSAFANVLALARVKAQSARSDASARPSVNGKDSNGHAEIVDKTHESMDVDETPATTPSEAQISRAPSVQPESDLKSNPPTGPRPQTPRMSRMSDQRGLSNDRSHRGRSVRGRAATPMRTTRETKVHAPMPAPAEQATAFSIAAERAQGRHSEAGIPSGPARGQRSRAASRDEPAESAQRPYERKDDTHTALTNLPTNSNGFRRGNGRRDGPDLRDGRPPTDPQSHHSRRGRR